MLSAFFAKRRLRMRLSKFVSAEAAQAIADGKIDAPRIEARRMEFVFVFVRADSPEELAERTGLVSEIGNEHGAVVHALVGPLVTMAFGTHKAAQCQPMSRVALVNHLQRRFGTDVRIVHGEADGHFGNFGGPTRFSYTFSFPRFDSALAAVARLEFGQARELPP